MPNSLYIHPSVHPSVYSSTMSYSVNSDAWMLLFRRKHNTGYIFSEGGRNSIRFLSLLIIAFCLRCDHMVSTDRPTDTHSDFNRLSSHPDALFSQGNSIPNDDGSLFLILSCLFFLCKEFRLLQKLGIQ